MLFDSGTLDKDVVYTPDWCARDIVQHFKPEGRVLEPSKGGGAFLQYLPGAEWCEITEGRDQWGGIAEMRHYGGGSALGFPMGNAVAAFHFRKDWHGDMKVTHYKQPNAEITGRKIAQNEADGA